ncbi:hypothetical protein BDR26DRAFT_858669 [Obelidium mucronatum]|nr:hypothetical protein BDR26DRAFT_858669 [Obelidium mucronatum]
MNFLLVGLIFVASLVQAQCDNLGNWLPSSRLNNYLEAPEKAVTSDGFKNCLRPGFTLPKCWKLTSPNKQSSVILQPDGNAVIYSSWYNGVCNTGMGCISSTWSSGSNNKGSQSIQLGAGRFYVSQSGAPGYSGVVWDANKQGSLWGTLLCMQNDGNLVVYDNGNSVVWSANTRGA